MPSATDLNWLIGVEEDDHARWAWPPWWWELEMDFAVVVDLGIDLDGMHGANTRYSPEFCRLLCRFGREPVVSGVSGVGRDSFTWLLNSNIGKGSWSWWKSATGFSVRA
jgi:hypothetical protein